ncbi:MAG: hypothetical protein RL308_1298 [Bacteroidota bacterium]|jgi:hypothetical protein
MSVVNELEKFGKYVVQQSKSNLSKKKKKDTSNLYNGVKFEVTKEKDSTTLSFDFGTANDYWQFVDKGVKGVSSSAKAPNSPFKFGTGTGKSGGLTKGINGWVARKRIQFQDRKTKQFLSYKATAFLIIRSIWNKGLETTNFFTKPFEQAFKRVPDDIYAAYALEVEEQLKVRLK